MNMMISYQELVRTFLSDHRFMKLCSWYGIPRQSQFAEAVSMKIFGEL